MYGQRALLPAAFLLAGSAGCCASPSPHREWRGPFQSVIAMEEGTCALKGGAPGLCWGSARVKVMSPPAGPFVKLSSAGGYALCGLDPAGKAACSGVTAPRGDFIDIAACSSEICTVARDGLMLCEPIGLRRPLSRFAVKRVQFDGHDDVCTLDRDGSVGCYRRVDPDRTVRPNPPWDRVLPGSYAEFSVHHGAGCALRDDGRAECWGSAGLAPPPGAAFTRLSVGGSAPWGHAACGVDHGGSIQCFGAPLGGQKVAPPAGRFTDVSLHRIHACALRDDKAVVCWGGNAQGQVTGRWWM